MHMVKIGSVEIAALLDAPFLQSPKFMAPEHADEMAEEYHDDLDDRGLVMGAITSYLVRSAGKLVLVDTGIGPRKRPGFPSGHLSGALHDAGVRPEEIDVVIHTHLHIDHIGWNTCDTEDGRTEIFFPNARFVIQQAEWDYWMTPEMLADPRSGRLTFTQGEESFDEHIVFVSAPGHSPGHIAVGIADGSERGIIIGDASHHPVHVSHPDWRSPLDWDSAMAAASRDRVFNLAADEHRIVMAGHWNHPGWGYIVRLDGRRSFRAL